MKEMTSITTPFWIKFVHLGYASFKDLILRHG